MRAIVMHSFGDAGVLRLEDLPAPDPQQGSAVVRVGAVEVSRTRDVATRSGKHPLSRGVTLPHILGGDFVGVVESVAEDADPVWVGRRVAVSNGTGCGHCEACTQGVQHECVDLQMLGVHKRGSYAEFAVAPTVNLTEIPEGIGMAEAAALAATGPIATMQLNVAGVRAAGTVLVPGASGALSSLLISLMRWLGLHPIGLSRRPDRPDLRVLGIPILDSTRDDLSAAILTLSGERGLDGAIDNVASPAVFDRYLPALSRGAIVVISGALTDTGLPVLSVPAVPFYLRSLSLIGLRSPDQDAVKGFWDYVRQGFRLPDGLITVFDHRKAADAHRMVEAGNNVGHTILQVNPDLW